MAVETPASSDQVSITFQPMGVTVDVRRGETLFEAAADVGVDVDTICGGNGVCGKCKVRVGEPHLVPAKPIDHVHLAAVEVARGYRLSCQIKAADDLVVDVPAGGRRSIKILHHGLQRDVPLRPNALKIHLPYLPPRQRDGVADWDAVKDTLPGFFRRVEVPLPWLRQLPAAIRNHGGMTLTVVGRRRVTRIELGDTTLPSCGIAIDIGSTSVVAYLVDLDTGTELAVASDLNTQAIYGDDVIGRLSKAQFDPVGLKRLHDLIIAQLNDVVGEVLSLSNLARSAVTDVTVVGNMAMHHFLLQLDSTYLGLSPFAPVTRDAVTVTAAELALDLEPDTPVYVLPNIAGFVGSDTVGLMLASGMADSDEIQMAVDVGTNGEVVLGSAGRLVACSAPAGPAFEGARIKHGMRATTGAIDHVTMNRDVSFS
ncbi:MAG: ASKHA domain-containing protein, partial [Acidimicrobiia bacterium]|nr:ASKHA domain-containing protein [Acidimicrobiia bacterium]